MTLNLDHGDTLATALSTSLGSASGRPVVFTEEIGDGPWARKDVDLYKFTASAGDRLTAITALPTGGRTMDTYLRLFDSSGVELAFNDDVDDGPLLRDRLRLRGLRHLLRWRLLLPQLQV